jgi:hypothetical protein
VFSYSEPRRVKAHLRHLSSFCAARPAFASQRLGLQTFRRSDLRFPLASRRQRLLLSKLPAPINHAESTLPQLLILKQLKVPLESSLFQKRGGGAPLWLTTYSKRVSIRRGLLESPSSIFRTHFQVPYPATPLFVTLTKTPGGMGVFFPFWNSSRATHSLATGFNFNLLFFQYGIDAKLYDRSA